MIKIHEFGGKMSRKVTLNELAEITYTALKKEEVSRDRKDRIEAGKILRRVPIRARKAAKERQNVLLVTRTDAQTTDPSTLKGMSAYVWRSLCENNLQPYLEEEQLHNGGTVIGILIRWDVFKA